MVALSVQASSRGDGGAAILEVRSGLDVVARLELDIYDLETLIYELAKVREQLSEPVPDALDIGARVLALVEPKTQILHTLGASSPDEVVWPYVTLDWDGYRVASRGRLHLF